MATKTKRAKYPQNLLKEVQDKILLIQNRLKTELGLKKISPAILSDEQARKIFDMLIQRIPEKQQIILIEIFEKGKNFSEVALQLSLTKERVRQLMSVAVKNLCDGPQALFFIYGYEDGLKTIQKRKTNIESGALKIGTLKEKDFETLKIPASITQKDFFENKEQWLKAATNKTQKARIEKAFCDYNKLISNYTF